MHPMQILLIAMAIGGLVYFFALRRQFDVFTLAFTAAIFYFIPGISGFVVEPQVQGSSIPIPISTTAYSIYIMVLAGIFFTTIYDDHSPHNPISRMASPHGDMVRAKLVIAAGIITALLFIVIEWNEIWGTGKPNYGRTHAIFQIAGIAGFIIAIMNKWWVFVSIFSGFMALDVYAGNREMPAISLLVYLVVANQDWWRRINTKLRVLLAGFGVFFVLVFYKGIYQAIRSGNLDLAGDRLTDPQYYTQSLARMEPFTTQLILEKIVSSGYSVDANFLKPLLHNFLVFSPELGAESVRFQDGFKQSFYPWLSWGMASNIWAEGYALGGIVGVIILILGFCWLLKKYASWIRATQGVGRGFLAISAVYLFFFIHRTGIVFEATLQKRIIMLAILIWVLAFLLSKVGQAEPVRYTNDPEDEGKTQRVPID